MSDFKKTACKIKSPTPNQSAILQELKSDSLDIDELMDAIEYGATKAAFQFTLKKMVSNGWIKKLPTQNRRGRSRRLYEITDCGKEVVRIFIDTPPALVV